jgi:hypothetical protein
MISSCQAFKKTFEVAVGPIALNPSNLTIHLHLMHLVRQLLHALFVQLVDRQRHRQRLRLCHVHRHRHRHRQRLCQHQRQRQRQHLHHRRRI